MFDKFCNWLANDSLSAVGFRFLAMSFLLMAAIVIVAMVPIDEDGTDYFKEIRLLNKKNALDN